MVKYRKNEQRRIYSESLSNSIRQGWNQIGSKRTKLISSEENTERESDKSDSRGFSRPLDDVIKEASTLEKFILSF